MQLINGLFQKLKYLAARQKIVAGNIARANMPGAKAFDLTKPNFAAELSKAGKTGNVKRASIPAQTSSGHLSGTIPFQNFKSQKQKVTYEMTPSGNQISLDEQLLKAQEIQIQTKTVNAQIRKEMELFRRAIGK